MKTKSLFPIATALILGSLLGCHQEPVLPSSLIAAGCRVGLAETIQETQTTQRKYYYNSFGDLIAASDSTRFGQRLLSAFYQRITYSPDHYLQAQDYRSVEYGSDGSRPETRYQYSYEYAGDPKRIRRIQKVFTTNKGSVTTTEEHEYVGGREVIQEKNSAGTVTIRYEFGADGKLQSITGTEAIYTVVNGKLIRRVQADGTIVNEEFYPSGQLKTQEVIRPSKERYVLRFGYDDKPNSIQTQLRFRGFSGVDSGGDVLVNNLKSYETTSYAANGAVVSQTNETYGHRYNSQGFPTGYASNLGNRANYYYTNCP